MSKILQPKGETLSADDVQLVGVRIGTQLIGLPITVVRDVFSIAQLTPVPRADRAVVGLVNLRGHIVTILDLGCLLGEKHRQSQQNDQDNAQRMAVGIEWQGEVFGLVVDEIGDVATLRCDKSEAMPANVSQVWSRYAHRVHKLETELMIEIDLYALLDTMNLQAA
jgi:purine-binding chemotaxis protein CheW